MAQTTQNIWNFMVGKSSVQEIAILAIIREQTLIWRPGDTVQIRSKISSLKFDKVCRATQWTHASGTAVHWNVVLMPFRAKFINFGNVFSELYTFFCHLPLTWFYVGTTSELKSCFCWRQLQFKFGTAEARRMNCVSDKGVKCHLLRHCCCRKIR